MFRNSVPFSIRPCTRSRRALSGCEPEIGKQPFPRKLKLPYHGSVLYLPLYETAFRYAGIISRRTNDDSLEPKALPRTPLFSISPEYLYAFVSKYILTYRSSVSNESLDVSKRLLTSFALWSMLRTIACGNAWAWEEIS